MPYSSSLLFLRGCTAGMPVQYGQTELSTQCNCEGTKSRTSTNVHRSRTLGWGFFVHKLGWKTYLSYQTLWGLAETHHPQEVLKFKANR